MNKFVYGCIFPGLAAIMNYIKLIKLIKLMPFRNTSEIASIPRQETKSKGFFPPARS